MCAPTEYHLRDPDVSKKLAMFGLKFTIPSTCHLASSLHTTDNPPRCLIYACIPHT